MLRRQHNVSASYQGAEPNHDDLVVRIRRLVQHRAYDRAQIGSALLKRLVPGRTAYGQAFPEADLRQRLSGAALDANAVAYLLISAEAELDLARQRMIDA